MNLRGRIRSGHQCEVRVRHFLKAFDCDTLLFAQVKCLLRIRLKDVPLIESNLPQKNVITADFVVNSAKSQIELISLSNRALRDDKINARDCGTSFATKTATTSSKQ
jgi:hypothetical protein